MAEIILFGGTTEGRELAVLLAEAGYDVLCCVASDYGAALLSGQEGLRIHSERMELSEMKAMLKAEAPRLILDATHPYAVEVREKIRRAAAEEKIPYLRVKREIAEPNTEASGKTHFVEELSEVEEYLNRYPEKTVFCAAGAKAAEILGRIKGAEKRLWMRVLPNEQSLQRCLSAGIPLKHVICIHGPVSEELNLAMFRETGAEILITKDSGETGGFTEKLRAAEKLGMEILVLTPPKESEGLSLPEIREQIRKRQL